VSRGQVDTLSLLSLFTAMVLGILNKYYFNKQKKKGAKRLTDIFDWSIIIFQKQ